MSKIKNWYYSMKMSGVYPYYNFKDIPEIISKYSTFDSMDEFSLSELESGAMFNDGVVYAFSNGVDTNLYYDNIKINISKRIEGEYVVRMFLKKKEDLWDLREYGDGTPVSDALLQIYLDYDVVVLDDMHCCNSHYEFGAWDEYVYNTVNKIIDNINNLCKENAFSISYNGRPKHQKSICRCKK